MIFVPIYRLYREWKDAAALRSRRDRLIALVEQDVMTLVDPALGPLASVRMMLAKNAAEEAGGSGAVDEFVERFERLRDTTMTMLITQAGQEPATQADVIHLQHALFDCATQAQADVARAEERQRKYANGVDERLATLTSDIGSVASVAANATAMTSRLSHDLETYESAEHSARDGLQARLVDCVSRMEAQQHSLSLLTERIQEQTVLGWHHARATRIAVIGLAAWSVLNTVAIVMQLLK